MGSPLSPVIANLFMEDLETKALETATSRPKLWLRYVDDTFVIWQHGREELDRFLEHLNNMHPRIKFTMEVEEQQKLPFLDVLVYKKTNNTLGHTLFQKKTHTNRYLNGNSHHHPAQLQAVPRTLVTRARRLADESHLSTELGNLRAILLQNQYPQRTVDRIIRETEQNTRMQRTEEDSNWPRSFLPYVRGTTDKIAKKLREYEIKTIFSTDRKIANILQTPKDRINLEEQGVYEIPCRMCPASYIGQTNRRMSVRRDEHSNLVAKKERTSSLYQHQAATGHDIDFEGTKMLAKIEHQNKRIIREAIEIEKHTESMNKRDDAARLPYIWKTALTHRKRKEDVTSPDPVIGHTTERATEHVIEHITLQRSQAERRRAQSTVTETQVRQEGRITRSQTRSLRQRASPEDGK